MELDALAHAIATDGIAAHEPAVAAFARLARRDLGRAGPCADLAPLLALVGDPTAPAVARERAFGRLAARVAAPGRSATPLVGRDASAAA